MTVFAVCVIPSGTGWHKSSNASQKKEKTKNKAKAYLK